MRGRWIVVVVCLALAAAPALAQQTSGDLILFGSTGAGRPVSTTSVPGRLTGMLTVSFHGDPATGCAGQGICGYSGTVVVQPSASAEVAIVTYRHGGRDSYQVQLQILGGPGFGGPGGGVTSAHVQRAGGGVCGDAVNPFVSLPATISRGVVGLPLLQPGGALLSTRCAGPLDADLAGLGPKLSLPVRQLLMGRRALDLSGTWSFAHGGFAGSVTSTLRLTLGRPAAQSGSSQPRFPKGVPTTRDRQLTETLRVIRAQGNMRVSVTSDSTTCQFLDSCQITGTVSATIDPQRPAGFLTVIGRASRPYDDFLAALGLSRRGNPRGLQVVGSVEWSAGGTVASALSLCSGQAPLGAGAVELTESGGRLHASYTVPTPMRTRCPGPVLSPGQILASGAGRLDQRSLTLTGTGSASDDGYTLSQLTRLSLTLGHGPVRQQTFLTPGG